MRRIPGTHVPNIKNRSSKQLIWFTKIKPAERSMSNEQLKDLSKKGYKLADKELTRRSNKMEKDQK